MLDSGIPYDYAGYQPPAPTCQVVVQSAASGKQSGSSTFLLDSGSDCTCLPVNIIKELKGGTQYEQILVRDFNGHRSVHKQWWVRIMIGNYLSGEIAALELDGDKGILGRDILNELHLLLQGPEKICTIKRA